MALSLLGILSAAGAGGAVGAVSYWLARLTGATFAQLGAIKQDASGNIYVSGQAIATGGAGANDGFVAKYDSSGTIQWQRVLGSTGTETFGGKLNIDSSGDVYVGGRTTSQGQGGNDGLVAKYDSSGTIQWQRILGGAGTDLFRAITGDSGGNSYAVGYTESEGQGGSDALIAKYNSSGTIQWQRRIGGAGDEEGNNVAIDSNGDVYIAGATTTSTAGAQDFYIVKYNSSGTLVWQRRLGSASGDSANGIAIDSTDSIYVAGSTAGAGTGTNDVLLAKYNSSGTLQWQRTLTGSGSDIANNVAVDSSNNVFISGVSSTNAGNDDVLIAKYDSSGTVQWQRWLRSTNADSALSVNVAPNGVVNFAGVSNDQIILGQLPNDGSLTGTYSVGGTSYVYEASTLTASTPSFTDATPTLTNATATLTDGTSSLTSATTTLTPAKTDL